MSPADRRISPATMTDGRPLASTLLTDGYVLEAAANGSRTGVSPLPLMPFMGTAAERGKPAFLRVIETIEQRLLRVRQLLQRRTGAGQILGALAQVLDRVRRFLFLVPLDA